MDRQQGWQFKKKPNLLNPGFVAGFIGIFKRKNQENFFFLQNFALCIAEITPFLLPSFKKGPRVVEIEILILEPAVGIDYNWVAGFGFLEVGFDRNLEFGFQ